MVYCLWCVRRNRYTYIENQIRMLNNNNAQHCNQEIILQLLRRRKSTYKLQAHVVAFNWRKTVTNDTTIRYKRSSEMELNTYKKKNNM